MREDAIAKIIGFYKDRNRKIFIQLDALSYFELQTAIQKRYVPGLARMLRKRGYKAYKYFSELPSNTPAAQMKIMYGLKGKIKGFRWYNKKEKRHYSFKKPATAEYWQEIAMKETKASLVNEGASYINLYSGGAERTVLTLSDVLDNSFNKMFTKGQIFRMLFLNADFILVLSYKLIREFIVELYEYMKYNVLKKPQRGQIFFPYIRMANNVFFKEIATMGTLLEMNEKTKNIYITYTGYDEIAHQRGPQSKEALKTLKSIDRSIRRIVRRAERKGYEVFIFSDHGQSTSIPFKKLYKYSLEEYIKNIIDGEHEVKEYNTWDENKYFLMTYLVTSSFKYLLKAGYNTLASIFKFFVKRDRGTDKEKKVVQEDVIVTNSGPLSHVYFNFSEERLTGNEIEKEYPGLINKLLTHEGVEFGVVKTSNGHEMIGKYGKVKLNFSFGVEEIKGSILKKVGIKKEQIIEAIKEISIDDDCGDIILFGAIFDKGVIVNFEEQYGGHGGIGGNQNYPFLITRKPIVKKNISISNLYEVFIKKEESV